MHPLAAVHVDGLHLMQALTGFQPVSPDVLDGRSANGTGNQRQIFQPRPARAQRPQHELMPVLASTRLDIPGIGILMRQSPTGNRHVQHQPVEIPGKHQIAAPAEDETRQHPPQGQQLRHMAHRHQTRRPCRQGQRAVRSQISSARQDRRSRMPTQFLIIASP